MPVVQSELIRIAVEMESSMLGKVGPDGKRSDRVRTSADLQVQSLCSILMQI